MRSDSNIGRLSAAVIGGMGAGAALMYVLDPDRGARRRATLRDQATHLMKSEKRDIVDKGVRDLQHRGGGLIARLKTSMRLEEVPDEILVERVRANLGHWVSHPRALELEVQDGRVTLRGPIFSSEATHVLNRVRALRGVRQVTNLLELHHSADVPALQGEPSPASRRGRQSWTPALRLFAAGAGLSTTAYGLGRGGLRGLAWTAIGGGLVLRSATNLPLRMLFGIGAGRQLIDIHKTFVVEAPVEEVFDLWSHFHNFPRFMEHVRSVEPIGTNRTRWTVLGPGRADVVFVAEIVAFDPPRIISWRTLPGQHVEHSGVVHFERQDDRHTRVQVQMSYNPPGGAIGHAVAKILGRDAKTSIDRDLIRMKSLLEQGKTRLAGHATTREELR